ncbi:hypothetical protein [Thermomonas sp.]|uniref:hypothetical protein n=1 Tax=Thermomonas sp. TaxID=1971895 RepID=UPI0035B212D1
MSILLKLDDGTNPPEQPGYLALVADDTGPDPVLAVVDPAGKRTVLGAAPEVDIASGGSQRAVNGPFEGATNVELCVAWDVVEPPAPDAVDSCIVWSRVGRAVSVSGYSDIVATAAAAGRILSHPTAAPAGGFAPIIGLQLGESPAAFGTVVVEDADASSPTFGQVVAHGYMHADIHFSVPAAGTYRVHFSGHLSVTAEPYVPGA